MVFVLKPAFAFEAEQQISEAPEGEPWDALCVPARKDTETSLLHVKVL